MPKREAEAELRAVLEATGLPWSIERGGHHHHVRLCGRLVGILPIGRGSTNRRAALNVRAQVRRAAKELSQ